MSSGRGRSIKGSKRKPPGMMRVRMIKVAFNPEPMVCEGFSTFRAGSDHLWVLHDEPRWNDNLSQACRSGVARLQQDVSKSTPVDFDTGVGT